MLKMSLASCRNNLMFHLTSRRLLFTGCLKSDVIPSATCQLCAVNTATQPAGAHGRALLHSHGRKVYSDAWKPSTHSSLWSAHQGQVRRLSISNAWCMDADDGIGTESENKTFNRSNQRGLRKGVRRGNQRRTQSNVGKGAYSVIGAREANLEDDLIDIHDPQGKDIPSENFNVFDAQYFGDETLSKTVNVKEENVSSDDPMSALPLEDSDEVEVQTDTDLNDFDQQYFGSSAVFGKPRKRKSQNITNAPKLLSFGSDMNVIDKQYFGSTSVSGTNSQTTVEHEAEFLDTSCDEQSILWQQKRKEQLLEQEIVALKEESLRIENSESHNEITPVDFDDMSNSKKVDRSINTQDIPESLQRELIAERRLLEQHVAQQNMQRDHLADVEPEVKATLLALKKKRKKKQSIVDQLKAGADINIASSTVPCSGCGAFLQCNSVDKPGFIQKEQFVSLLQKLEKPKIELTMKEVCVRCTNLMRQREALHVNVNQDDYLNIIKAIRQKRSLVLVMVDLLDFPCSFIPNLKDVIGEKHVCLVGNKMDVLPADSADYDARIKKHLLQACVEAGVCSEKNVQEIFLISAKTGYGIEKMITKLHKNWGTQGDVYLLGTANVGKSSLFNRLLESDYCKSKASYMMGKATISRWPGTTLNLLKFPIMNLNRTRVAQRVQRLQEEQKAEQDRILEKKFSKMRGEQVDPKAKLDPRAYVKGNVGRTFDYYERDHELGFSIGQDPFNLSTSKVSGQPDWQDKLLPFEFHPNEFNDGRWFYDTPGVIHEQQILTKLTLEELKDVVPDRVIQPKTVIIKPGQTFFLAGLGRLDYLQGNDSIYFTLFTNKNLSIRVVETEEADAYYEQHAGHKWLTVPIGGEDRMKNFPALKPVDMGVVGIGWEESVADILFSSAGWTSVTAGTDMEIHLRAYTLGGNGCLLRQPSLLPYAINMRGKRIKKTPFYGLNRKKLVKFIP